MSSTFDNDPDFHDPVPKPKSRRGFRLVEVLVGLGVIVLLIALLLPATRSSYPPRRMQCANNMRQIALALRYYEQVYGALPPAYTVDAKGKPLHSWRTLILPYLDHESLYKSIDLSKPWNDPVNASALKALVPVFRCPEAGGPDNTTTYLAVVGPNDCFLRNESRRLSEITDNHQSTLMFFEVGDDNEVPWMAPRDADESLVMRLGPDSNLSHPGGTNMALVDGSVRFVKATAPAEVRRAIMSISGGELVSPDEF